MMTALNPTKLRNEHLTRPALVYVRQSTLIQVRDNTASAARQYQLAQRAQALGWPAHLVVVIDQDQGRSGASRTGRDGFEYLIAEVGLGRAGAVLCLEASRLARSSSDWYRLIEICALTDTLVIDEDGVYDPGQYNDRLLLVQVPIKEGWKSCGFDHRVFTLGHHFRHGFGGPPKRMGMLIPFGDKSQQAFRKMFLVRKVGDLQSLPLQDRKPLLDLIHPGAMHRGKVEHEARMFGQPGLHLFALMHPE